jgi:hypothetical protein
MEDKTGRPDNQTGSDSLNRIDEKLVSK